MANRYFVNIDLTERYGVVLTIDALPRPLIFGHTPEEALRYAREAIGFQLGDTNRGSGRPFIELVPREPVGAHQPGYSPRTQGRPDRPTRREGPARSARRTRARC